MHVSILWTVAKPHCAKRQFWRQLHIATLNGHLTWGFDFRSYFWPFSKSQSFDNVNQPRKMVCNPVTCAHHKCAGLSKFFLFVCLSFSTRTVWLSKGRWHFPLLKETPVQLLPLWCKNNWRKQEHWDCILWLRQTFYHHA